jgi:hypothetical protein
MSTTPTPSLTRAEAHILEKLGGRRWTTKRYTAKAVDAAAAEWKAIYTAAGFATSALLTTDVTNPKLGKIGLPAYGITIHSARNALVAWEAAGPQLRQDLAAAVDASEAEVDRVLRHTVCTRSTKGCRAGCVTAFSVNGRNERSQLSRLSRHLFLMFRPASAFALMARQLDTARFQHGLRGARWRVNVSDDLRIELLAPGLFSVAPRPYSYTKWTPAQRPGRPGFRLVYSASETTSDQHIVDWCTAGHRVAVVMDVRKGNSLPSTWLGLPVVDGDETDDLFVHPEGVIVGLRAKGQLEARQVMLATGFTRPAAPAGPQPVRVMIRRPAGVPPVAAEPLCRLSDVAVMSAA